MSALCELRVFPPGPFDRFGPDAFTHNVGRTLPLRFPDGSESVGTVVAAEVEPGGRWAVLRIEGAGVVYRPDVD